MKSSKAFGAVVVAALAAFAAFGLVGCGGTNEAADTESGPVAATVNGVDIYENKVTDYIQNFRTGQALDTDEAWGTWLSSNASTPSDIRSQVIDMFVNEELVKAAAEEKKIEVTDDEVNEQVEQMRANYSDDEAWNKALEQAGTTEDEYRERVREAIIESKLQEKIVEEESPTSSDEDILEQAASFAPYFNGAKKSSHILFKIDDESQKDQVREEAQKVLDQINNGDITFEDAVSQYSDDEGSAANGGDVGWDQLNSFVTEYTDALAQLNKDQMSGLVESEFGYHIILCTDVFEAPEKVTSLDQLPPELVDYVRSMLDSSAESEAYTAWLEKYKEEKDVKINDMPSDLPYDIDPKLYAPAEENAETVVEDDASVQVETEDGTTTETTAQTEVEHDHDGDGVADHSAEDAPADETTATTAEATGETTTEGTAAEGTASSQSSGTEASGSASAETSGNAANGQTANNAA